MATWQAWDEQPGNDIRVNAYVDATVAYAGHAHVEFSRFVAAQRRAGADHLTAINKWEEDW